MLEVIDSPMTRFAQEAERRRIARELHDGVVQSLTALVADLEFFRSRRLQQHDAVGQEFATKLETWQDLARESLDSMRQALGGLRRHADYEFVLKASLDALVDELLAAGYTVTYECDEWPSLLPFEYSSNIYYIVREALTNSCKHAHASHITLFVLLHEGSMHVSIGDNGVGMIAPSQTGMRGGYQQGMVGMRERVLALGGRLSIESAPGKGTRIDIEMPLPL